MRKVHFSAGGCEIAASVCGDAARPALALLPGWPHDKSLYDEVIDRLGARFFVLAFDLPGIGGSRGAPPSSEKTVLADLLLACAEQAGARSIVVAGIDVGGMIAFAAARDHGARIAGAAVGNTVLPGLDPWKETLANPAIWHFAFHAVPDLPESLISGREDRYFEFFFDKLGNARKPLPQAMRAAFVDAYRRPEALKAGFDWYRTLAADAERNAVARPIATPTLYFRGDADGRSSEPYLRGLRQAGARDLRARTFAGTAEFTPLEAPDAFIEVIGDFAAACAASG
mgnify:CR=1 FL=1